MSFDEARDPKKEPSIKEMTEAAIKILSRNKKGYVLMVEGGRIDHGNHLGIARLAIGDTRAMAKAVGSARETTKKEETLIIVTSDHGHVLSLSGYPVRGNPILGKVVGNDKYMVEKTKTTQKTYQACHIQHLTMQMAVVICLEVKLRNQILPDTSTRKRS